MLGSVTQPDALQPQNVTSANEYFMSLSPAKGKTMGESSKISA
jgi:hypothetical protein